MLKSPHVEGIQDSLGFWIPSRGFRIPCTGFQSLSVEVGLWIPIVSGISDSLSCILDSKTQDSGFLTGLRSKRFRGKGFSVLTAREMKREQKIKEGEGKGKEGLRKGRKVSFLSSPTPPLCFTCAIFRAVFDSCSSFFAPKPYRNACYAG